MSAPERARCVDVRRRSQESSTPSGRAFERTDYRFELVTATVRFGTPRHRLLTIEWQPLTADLGYDVPDVIAEAGLADRYTESLRRSADSITTCGVSSRNRRSTPWPWRFEFAT